MPTSSFSKKLVFHLLPNAHLDPVWLWDWREGLNEGLKTAKIVLDLMDEFPQLTFIRGEAAIYRHIEKNSPALFRRIERMVGDGRWDVVGGTVIQPDSNMASTETLCRQFEEGLTYFGRRFGHKPTVSWQADSFGHTPGWPNILTSFGMESFAFTRPQQKEFPLKSPLFWWEGDHGNRLLCYRQHWMWYCSERGNMSQILDKTLEDAVGHPHLHVGILIGLGDHGGGPSRRHILDIEKWHARHQEVEVRFSTLHGLFRELKKEAATLPSEATPVVTGDLGYCLRGCYSSVQKFKSLYRKAETLIVEAEAASALVGNSLKSATDSLSDAWNSILFNSFHDILPGSSIERAMEEQIAWVGLAQHRAQEARFEALNKLALQVDTSVVPATHKDRPTDVPFLVWNPLPQPFKGMVELEGPLDYRPLFQYQHRRDEVPLIVTNFRDQSMPFQEISTENTSMLDVPWRKRVLVPLEIPALGWTVVRLGYRDKVPVKAKASGQCMAIGGKACSITNGDWTVKVQNAGLKIKRQGENFFTKNNSIELRVVEDPWGSWGGMQEEKDSYCLEAVREKWTLSDQSILESGPLRSKLWTRWQGRNSWIELIFSVAEKCPWIKVEARLLWNERSARLKLVLPCLGAMRFDVPGSQQYRETAGQLPMGRWVQRVSENAMMGFASDVLGDVDYTDSELRITLARASRYANDVKTRPDERRWEPAVDSGELKFQFSLFGDDVSPDSVAESLLWPPSVVLPLPQKGRLPAEGSLGSIEPASVRLLSIRKLNAKKLQVRIQNRGDRSTHAALVIGEKKYSLGKLGSQQIKTITI